MTKLVCRYCGSDRVFLDATVNANDPSDFCTHDHATCERCNGDTHLVSAAEFALGFATDEERREFEQYAEAVSELNQRVLDPLEWRELDRAERELDSHIRGL
jgi:hypothetical protein